MTKHATKIELLLLQITALAIFSQVFSSKALASQITCKLTEKASSASNQWFTTMFQLDLDAANSGSQLIVGHFAKMQLNCQRGISTLKILNEVEQTQYEASFVDGINVSTQLNPASIPGRAIFELDCNSNGLPDNTITHVPKSLHCNFHEQLGKNESAKTSVQEFDVLPDDASHHFTYLPTAKLLNMYGLAEASNGLVFLVFETKGNTVATSGIGPWNHTTKLAWSPGPNSQASVTCNPVY